MGRQRFWKTTKSFSSFLKPLEWLPFFSCLHHAALKLTVVRRAPEGSFLVSYMFEHQNFTAQKKKRKQICRDRYFILFFPEANLGLKVTYLWTDVDTEKLGLVIYVFSSVYCCVFVCFSCFILFCFKRRPGGKRKKNFSKLIKDAVHRGSAFECFTFVEGF